MRTFYIVVVLALAAVAALLLVPSTLLASNWPWLLVLACPLMHLFMRHGHGGQMDHHHTVAKGDVK